MSHFLLFTSAESLSKVGYLMLAISETKVLELLMRSKDRVVAKRLVEDHIFGPSGDVASNAVEVSIHRLRKQLSGRGAKVQIHTIRGVGYLMSEENELSP
jgi:DNA-binding response OmpR family regulator